MAKYANYKETKKFFVTLLMYLFYYKIQYSKQTSLGVTC